MLTLVRQGILGPRAAERGLALGAITPNRLAWAQFLDRALLILGVALAISGVFFFFAYNWQGLNHVVKLGLTQVLVLAAVVFVHLRGLDGLPGKIGLTVASLLVGVMLGVYGQVYQTGADSYELFMTWLLLILGWMAVSQFMPVWFLAYVLAHLAIATYWSSSYFGAVTAGPVSLALILFIFNTLALTAWEVARRRHVTWLESRATPRVVAFVAYLVMVAPVLALLFGLLPVYMGDIWGSVLQLSPMVYLLGTGITIYLYGRKLPDLFMLALAAFGLVAVLFGVAVKYLVVDSRSGGAESLLLTALILIGLTGAAVLWLRRTSEAWEAADGG